MAVKICETLVLRGVRVAGDVVTGLKRAGFNPAMAQTAAMSQSPRHPHCARENTGPDTPCASDVAVTAVAVSRAGRPERLAGSPGHRPAIKAGRSILSGWSRGYSLREYPSARQASGRQSRQASRWQRLRKLERLQAEPTFTSRLQGCTRPLGERGA
jgi:hypothetical protein